MTTEEATQKGVSKRDRDYEELVNARMEENESTLEEETIEEDVSEEEVEVEPEKKEETFIFQAEDGTTYEVPKNSKTKIKVDGEEIERTADTIFRRHQKGAAGDKRLQEAALVQQKLEEEEQFLNQRNQELSTKEKQILSQLENVNQAKKDGDLSDDDHSDEIDRLTEALVDADSNTAREILSKRLKGVTPDDLLAQAEDRINQTVDQRLHQRLTEQEKIEQEKQQREYQNRVMDANAKFEDEYPELCEDPMLYDLTNQVTTKIQSESPDLDPWSIIKTAADQVKEWQGSKFAKKVVKKKTSPTPASGRASIGKEEKPTTRQDIINEQRKARGQPAI